MSAFNDSLTTKIEGLVVRYETRRSSILPILHAIQDDYGYISDEQIEELHSDKLDERAALLAYHWEQAGEALTAARWYVRAAGVAGVPASPCSAGRRWCRAPASPARGRAGRGRIGESLLQPRKGLIHTDEVLPLLVRC